MHQKGFAPILIIFVIVIILGITGGLYYYKNLVTFSPKKDQVCTQEAKQCPDGSYVSRLGPNCEFTQCSQKVLSSTSSSFKQTNTPLISGAYLKINLITEQNKPAEYGTAIIRRKYPPDEDEAFDSEFKEIIREGNLLYLPPSLPNHPCTIEVQGDSSQSAVFKWSSSEYQDLVVNSKTGYAAEVTLVTTGPALMNTRPTANAGGPYKGSRGTPITLIGQGEDPDGDPLYFSWDLDHDGNPEIEGKTATFDTKNRSKNSYIVEFSVCDARGNYTRSKCATSEATVIIEGKAPNPILSSKTGIFTIPFNFINYLISLIR